MKSIADRIDALDWNRIDGVLEERGWATTGPLLNAQECTELAAGYDDDALFRSRVVMERHGFGRGEYRYYAYPLPDRISLLRAALYERLVAVANEWRASFGPVEPYPPHHSEYLRRCHEAGQRRPTPILLRYGQGDYNCLHQDLYGEHFFPLQAAFLLAEPGKEFEGGEFVLTEQRPRLQSRVHVVSLLRGEAVLFAVNERPVIGARGPYRVRMRHGVSPVRTGQRHTLGVIFHDAA